jgi:putative flippase GtrA
MRMRSNQFWVWGLVGILTNVLDYLIFILFHGLSGSIPFSNFLSLAVSSAFNFYQHRTKTFRNESNLHKQIYRYIIYQILVWVLSSILISLISYSGFSIGLAKILPLVVIAPLNFFALKYVVYK